MRTESVLHSLFRYARFSNERLEGELVMIRNVFSIAVFALLLANITGCASENLRTQALESGATDLGDIKTPLTLLAVRISPLQANMRIRGLVLRDRKTNQRKVFSFFRNAILRSKSVPYTVENDAVVQSIVLDLPAGEYEFVSISFTSTETLP